MAAAKPLLFLPQDLERIGHHGEASYPLECCGFLLGRAGEDAVRVEQVVPAGNEARGSDSFTLHPEAVLAVHKEARAAGLSVIGFYHSHPDQPARPSRRDREAAWAGMSYLIVSVTAGRRAEFRSWALSSEAAVEQEVLLERAA